MPCRPNQPPGHPKHGSEWGKSLPATDACCTCARGRQARTSNQKASEKATWTCDGSASGAVWRTSSACHCSLVAPSATAPWNNPVEPLCGKQSALEWGVDAECRCRAPLPSSGLALSVQTMLWTEGRAFSPIDLPSHVEI